MTTIPKSEAVRAPDPPPGPKGPTKAAVDEAVRSIVKAQEWLVGALGEITGEGLDLDECQNWLRETRLYVGQAERAIAYAREIRGHRAPADEAIVDRLGFAQRSELMSALFAGEIEEIAPDASMGAEARAPRRAGPILGGGQGDRRRERGAMTPDATVAVCLALAALALVVLAVDGFLADCGRLLAALRDGPRLGPELLDRARVGRGTGYFCLNYLEQRGLVMASAPGLGGLRRYGLTAKGLRIAKGETSKP